MKNNQDQPNKYDAVLGGNAPPPIHGAVLGGIEGVKKRLASSDVDVQISALKEALNYDKTGLHLVLEAVEDNRRKVRQAAVELLQDRNEPQAKLVLKNYKFWGGFERLYDYPNEYSTKFANRKVIEFDQKIGITHTIDTAYALRANYYSFWEEKEYISIEDKLQILQKEPQKRLAEKIEALVFGNSANPDKVIFTVLEKFPNLKAIFIYDIKDDECMISGIPFLSISPILEALPYLEILKIRGSSSITRGGETWVFSPSLKHDNLKALTIESGGISREVITQFCQLELPTLEYLELWLGDYEYGGTSDIGDILPIISGKYPKLKYLGLRNSQYSNNIAFALVDSPIIENLIELDLSMGTLTDEGAEALLNCRAIHQLDTLDISENCLSDEIIKQLSAFKFEVINTGYQKHPEERYCSVAE